MRYSKPHSSDSQSLIVNNKYTTWSAYLGVDKLLNAIWHNVFSMSVLASLLFLAVTIGSPPHFNILTKTAASSVAASGTTTAIAATNKLLATFFPSRLSDGGNNSKKKNEEKNLLKLFTK